MSEYEKPPPYNTSSAPSYSPQQYPQPGFRAPQQGFHGPQQVCFTQPQPSGYAQAPQSQIVMPSTTVIQAVGFGESPRQTVCPNCQSTIVTRVRSETSNCQHLFCCLMLVTGVCTIFSCLPYCCDSCANVRHECPRCGTHLGSYNR